MQEITNSGRRYLRHFTCLRQIPELSLSFGPFNLQQARYVRGRIAIFQEILAGDWLDDDAKSSYDYVVELLRSFEDTCHLAKEELQKAKLVKNYYDQKAKERPAASPIRYEQVDSEVEMSVLRT